MSEIENVRKVIVEEALPNTRSVKHRVEDIIGTDRTAANYLALAKKGLIEHVLPHLKAASATEEDLKGHFLNAVKDAYSADKAARTAFGNDSELGVSITSTMTNLQQHLAQDAFIHRQSLAIAKEDTSRIEAVIERLDLTSQYFFNAADNTKEYGTPLNDIIDRLENFEI